MVIGVSFEFFGVFFIKVLILNIYYYDLIILEIFLFIFRVISLRVNIFIDEFLRIMSI